MENLSVYSYSPHCAPPVVLPPLYSPPCPHSSLPSKLFIAILWSFHCFPMFIYDDWKKEIVMTWSLLWWLPSSWLKEGQLTKLAEGKLRTNWKSTRLSSRTKLKGAQCSEIVKSRVPSICFLWKKQNKNVKKVRCQGSPGARRAQPCNSSCVWLNQEDCKRLVGMETNILSLHLGLKMGTINLVGKTEEMLWRYPW